VGKGGAALDINPLPVGAAVGEALGHLLKEGSVRQRAAVTELPCNPAHYLSGSHRRLKGSRVEDEGEGLWTTGQSGWCVRGDDRRGLFPHRHSIAPP